MQKRFNDAERFTTGSPQPSHPSPGRTATMRDTFSFPRDDHRLFAELQQRCFAAGFSASKSELVRAGLHALAAMPGEALAATLGRIEKLKPWTGPARADGRLTVGFMDTEQPWRRAGGNGSRSRAAFFH